MINTTSGNAKHNYWISCINDAHSRWTTLASQLRTLREQLEPLVLRFQSSSQSKSIDDEAPHKPDSGTGGCSPGKRAAEHEAEHEAFDSRGVMSPDYINGDTEVCSARDAEPPPKRQAVEHASASFTTATGSVGTGYVDFMHTPGLGESAAPISGAAMPAAGEPVVVTAAATAAVQPREVCAELAAEVNWFYQVCPHCDTVRTAATSTPQTSFGSVRYVTGS
eukprot:7385360-Prymnesium_polylepis.2